MGQREWTQRRAPGHTHRKGMSKRRDQHRPTASRHRATPGGARLPTHAAEARTSRRTDRTGSCPPAKGGHTHRESRREHLRAAHHHRLSARRRHQPQQGPPHRHQKRKRTRPQHRGLQARTPRGHWREVQAPREGNPADTYQSHQSKRHTRTPAARIQRATPHLTATPSHQPATKARPVSCTTTRASLTTTDPTRRPQHRTTRGNTAHRTVRCTAVQRTRTRHPKTRHTTTRRGATRHSAAHHGTTPCNTARQSRAHHNRAQTSTTQHGEIRHDTPQRTKAHHNTKARDTNRGSNPSKPPHTPENAAPARRTPARGRITPRKDGGGPPTQTASRSFKPEPRRQRDTEKPRPPHPGRHETSWRNRPASRSRT